MIIVHSLQALRQALLGVPAYHPGVAFVPTMGALHHGHISLVAAARRLSPTVVTSIFVNPTQFNDPADFARYPKSLEQDIDMLEAAGTHLLFLPEVATLYPQGTQHLPPYPLGRLEQLLEGVHRPGHFQGVCQVVHRLLQAVQPGHLLLGAKDYQQCMVVRQLLLQTALPIQLQIVPTMREADGLAMSSRNRRLGADGRQKAASIYRTLQWINSQWPHAQPAILEAEARRQLLAAGFESVDYCSICHAHTLEPLQQADADEPAVALVAATLEGVRLIDNLPLGPKMA
ncbi:MAG: pantoate--beta-alanine ligase [Chitinophagaceae bacterium]|nr:pantoate--beta-alanine ligase [Chitinophagaceae bacterium]